MSAEPETPARSRRRLAWPLVLLGLITVAVIVFILVSPRRDMQGRDAAAGVVAGGTPEAQLRVTRARPLAGTNLVEIDIGTGGYRGGSFSSYGSEGEQRNILLLDRASGAVRRLLRDNGRSIEDAWFLPAQANYVANSSDGGMPAGEDSPPPAYFVLLVAQAEHDERLDLLVGSLAGPAQGFVMQGIDGVDAIWMQSATQIGLLVRERRNLFYRIVDIPTLRVVQQHPVAIG
jgi:hypothetical protein